MRIFKYFAIICLVFLATLLDVSFFSNFDIYGSTFLSSFVVLITLSILASKETFLIGCFSFVLLVAAFSSFPLSLIILNYVFVPLIPLYLKRSLPDASPLFAAIYFGLAAFAFQSIVCVYAWITSQRFEISYILSIFAFVLMETVAGVLFYSLILRVFKPSKLDLKVG